jgi:hypothetical protein
MLLNGFEVKFGMKAMANCEVEILKQSSNQASKVKFAYLTESFDLLTFRQIGVRCKDW